MLIKCSYAGVDIYYKSMMLRVMVMSVCFLVAVNTISMSVSSLRDRCMIVSSGQEENQLKVDFKFEGLDFPASDGYRIILLNTETRLDETYYVADGVFRRQFRLDPNVVYKLCIRIIKRTSNQQTVKVMQYSTSTTHRYSGDVTKIKVPDHLLKVKDLTETYQYLGYIKHLFQMILRQSGIERSANDLEFEEMKNLVATLETITFIEFAVICLFGLYQYFRLRQAIETAAF